MNPDGPGGEQAVARQREICRRAKILIVDDEIAAADLLRRILLEAGYRAVEIEVDPERVVARFREFAPDLVVLDWVMTPLSGADLLSALRAEIGQSSYLPILVVTAHLQPEIRNEALQNGATDFLVKPYDTDEIVLRVANFLEIRFLQLALRESDERMRALLQSMDEIVFEFDEIGTYLDIWVQDEGLLARPKSELIGRRISDVLGEETAAPFVELFRRVMAQRRAERMVYDLDVQSGRQWFLARVSPVFSPDGNCRTVCMLSREITEQKRVEQELRKTKEEAERANAAKSEFLSRMSHELRTPLNAIIGFAQLAELDAKTPDEHENFEQILRASTHLLQLINEVLDISRIEAGNIPILLKPVPLQLAMKEACDLIRPLAQENKVKLSKFSCNYYLNADGQRLQQVLLNLLANGIKYNKPGGEVVLRCQETSRGRLRVEVRDNGVGIEKYELPQLFHPFQRLNATAETVEGVGLGLVICQRLLRSMGGTIGVESEPGVGSTFWFELPLVRSMPDSESAPPDTSSRLPETLPAGARTLLYIEDNLPNLKLVERILGQRPGIKMITAQQGSMGLELARQHQPDLILLDLRLPDMNGDQVLVWLRSEPRTTDIPVVVISADAVSSEVKRLKELGARAYITKPFEVQYFLEVLDQMLARP